MQRPNSHIVLIGFECNKYTYILKAKYFYYLHGPLARVEVGDKQVQGTDYAYTINGWIKTVNANTLNATLEIGKDALTGTQYHPVKAGMHSSFAKDAFGYSLGYFNNDYKAISGTTVTNNLTGNIQSSPVYNSANQLYNGNIMHMSTALLKPNGNALPLAMELIGKSFRYDQLNRIRLADAYTGTGSDYTTVANTNNLYKETFTYDANGNILTLVRNGTSQTPQMDNMAYYYYDINNTPQLVSGTTVNVNLTNKLAHVTDAVNAGNYNDDIDNQNSGNYTYDKIGNLISDAQEQIANIDWTVYGKIKSITRTAGSTKPDLQFAYDAMGNRISKLVIPKNGSGQQEPTNKWVTTYYVRDASSNVMATYERNYNTQSGLSEINLEEQNIYGSSRLGVVNRNANMATLPVPSTQTVLTRELGNINYELSNHLGNVLAVISDRKLAYSSNQTTVDYYLADVVSATDYTAFGSLQVGRVFNGASYKYGYQGSETDNEITSHPERNITTFYREGDTYAGQWWSIDPKAHASWSPYAMMNRNPILFNDVLGDTVWLYATTLPGSSGLARYGTHTFIVVKTSDDVIHYYVYGPQDDNAKTGGSPLVRKSWGDGLHGGYPQDKEIINGTDKGNNLNNKFLIAIPEGMTQDEFDQMVINAANSFGNNPEIEYNAFSDCPTTGNCNTSTTTILVKAGVSQEAISDIKNIMKGVKWGFGDVKPWTKKEQAEAIEQKKKDDNVKNIQRKIDGPTKF